MKILLHSKKIYFIFFIILMNIVNVNNGLSETLHFLTPTTDKYKDGRFEVARNEINNWIKEGTKYIEDNNISTDQARVWLDLILQAVESSSLNENIYFGSLNETNIKRQISIEYVESLVNKMEVFYLKANNKGALKIDNKRDQMKVEFMNKSRQKAIISFIKLSKSNIRTNIYNKHKDILDSEGITLESIISSSEEKARKSKKKEKIKAAEEDMDAIKSVLKSYYGSLLTGDFTSKRSHFSKKNTDKDLKKLEDEYKHERDVEKDFDSIESVNFNDKTTVNIIDAKDDCVVVSVNNVILTLKKDDKTITTKTSDKFRMLKEDNKWVIWKNSKN